ncbi:MAG: uL30 family ribosomal protein [Nanoarchaeota archaeon]
MICIIRIVGRVNLNGDVKETLQRLRLGKKYSCVVLVNPNKEQTGMIKKLRDYVAFGEINRDVFEKLINIRGQKINKKNKTDSKKIVEEIEKGKAYESLNLKPFFRLHPPRGGINSKLHFPKGVLGDNKEHINKLIERML